ncbi:MAG: 6-phosphogluconolactonase [Oceanicaulis sp.]|uniref:6-phosphogluconolactonase n=1 Tax=Glycocaulis sp. TaxID=1969725 RepID=UPI0025B8E68B|nr:6-phosphogluconolactonase [Glycocaulis sp.]MCC5981720.1 6-phosphogluconolactonase [Oceanicaulis sp.]MCH8521937.1 6-phosphogluconolactonase [Glycocaulis sp.]
MTEPGPRFHAFADAALATGVLCARLVKVLLEAVTRRGAASLAVSGGSTPRALYQQLAREKLDWEKVTIVLADERWVEPGEAGSNESFVRSTLLTGSAEKARFIPLKAPGDTPVEGLEAVEARLADLPFPLDAAILGMGSDGHTLSWFPHAEGLENALSEAGARAAAITARKSAVTGDHLHRMTLTLAALQGVSFCALLIRGEDKRASFEAAALPGPVEDAPVRALLTHETITLEAYWSP